MRLIFTALVVAGLVGCSDAGPTSLAQRDAAPRPQATFALAPFRDALERIVPSLGTAEAVDAVRIALEAVIDDGSDGTLWELDAALHRLVATQPDASAEVDVIRLALQR